MISDNEEVRLHLLEQLSHDLIKFSYAATSLNNLHTHKKRYMDFCMIFKLRPFPVTQWQAVRYAAFLTFYFKSPKSVENYVSSICTINELSGFGKVVKGIFYKKAMAGIRRKLKHSETRAQPLTFEMLHEMLLQVNFNDDKELVAWVVVIYGFHLFLRKSNLVPDSKVLDDEKQFQRKDFRIHQDVMLAHIKWAKNRQAGDTKDKLLIPIIENNDSDLCPFYWFNYMVKRIPAPPHAAAFSYPVKNKLVPITYNQVMGIMRKWIKAIGLQEKRFSLHSARRGGCTTAFHAGLPSLAIKMLGDWGSTAYLRYIDITLDARLKAWHMFSLQDKSVPRSTKKGFKH